MLLTKEYQLLGQTIIGNTGSGNIYLRLYGRYIDQSIVDNTSLVQYKVVHYLPSPYTGITYWSSSAKLLGDVTGNYTAPTNKNYSAGETTVLEVSKTIEHNDDGSKAINVGGQFSDSYFAYPNTHTVTINNVECELPTIARKSSISCASPFNIGDYVTLNIDRKNNSFVHTIRYNFEDVGEKVIATNVNSSTYSWLTPSTMFTDGDMENKTSGTGYLTVETFNGDISLGVSDKFNFTANVPNNPPDIEATIIDSNTNIVENYTGDNAILVSGLSNAKITAKVTPKNNATLKSYKVTCGDGKSSTTYPTDTLNAITSKTFTINAVDSRGFPKTEIFESTFKDYFKPYATKIDIQRTEQTSKEVVANLSGKWWNNNFGIRDNTLKYSYRMRESGGTWGEWSTDTDLNISLNEFTISNVSVGTEFDTGKAYDIQFRLKDEVSYYELNAEQVTVSIPIVEVYDDEVAVFGDGYIENKLIVGSLESKNLFNKNEIYEGWLRYSDNFFFADSGGGSYYTSSYIEIKPDTIYTLNLYNADNLGTGGVMQYDASNNWLGDGIAETQTIITFTTKINAKYVRFVLRNDAKDYVQLEEGTINTNPSNFLTTIVESGKNDLGSWIKYSDGKMEIDQIISLANTEIATQWGSLYYAFKTVPNFPISFIEPPTISFGISGIHTVIVANGADVTKDSVVQVTLIRPEPSIINPSENAYLHITAKGYWK